MTTTMGRLLTIAVVTVICSSMASAELYHVSIDLSALGIDVSATDVELRVALYDRSDVTGDSHPFLDNVRLGSAIDDFTDGGGDASLEGFSDSPDLDFVSVEEHPLGTGNHVMRIHEENIVDPFLPSAYPALAVRNYFSPDGSVLSFDLDTRLSDAVGFSGLDELVVSLLDPGSLSPLVDGLAPGSGDVVAFTAFTVRSVTGVDVEVVPTPGACLLAFLGFGSATLKLRKKRNLLREQNA
jgi:hypothetical protein